MKPVKNTRVPDPVASYAVEYAQRHFLRPSDAVQSFLRRGMLEFQLEESRRRDGGK